MAQPLVKKDDDRDDEDPSKVWLDRIDGCGSVDRLARKELTNKLRLLAVTGGHIFFHLGFRGFDVRGAAMNSIEGLHALWVHVRYSSKKNGVLHLY
ncbi:hypothetical protein FNV43_RR09700 [Rhamnella rubrinervis]|uniref:Uncharacterized protein n=1 Tax=Rhamnella rubrinervis TaxID=2594499 RepID=A0A8K0HAX3_9ROSA|nr:hypothetical protein FNV43_RR09700 [Rhamnella rubrinervis]